MGEFIKTYELSTGMELLDKPDSLDELALQIRTASSEALRHANEATDGALISGRLLIEAKSQVKHGEWDSWVTVNCKLAPRTARAYMQLSRNVELLDLRNRQRVAILPIREAMKAISTEPTAPQKKAGTSVRAKKRTDAEKAVAIFSKAELALKASKKLIGMSLTVKSRQVTDLRQKLNEVLAKLNELEVSEEVKHG